MNPKQNTVAGVILAGGLARRMNNADKGLVTLNNKPLISYVLSELSTLLDDIYISANRNVNTYAQFGYPVITDLSTDFSGPLAGILSVMSATQADLLIVVPCDSPLIKTEHLQQLLKTLTKEHCDLTVAFDGERLHPVFLGLKTNLKPSLEAYLKSGERKLETWIKQHDWKITDFSNQSQIFTNINTYKELDQLTIALNKS